MLILIENGAHRKEMVLFCLTHTPWAIALTPLIYIKAGIKVSHKFYL